MRLATPAPEHVVSRLRRTAAELRALAKRHAEAENPVITAKLNEVAAKIEAEADAQERAADRS
jgi:hypothetical protein